MPYMKRRPSTRPPTNCEPGYRAGVDLDPKDRPSVPQERFDPSATGAHWDFPERQPENWPRERSIEHKFLTPVFGTSCPPKGLSEQCESSLSPLQRGRAAHWLILMAADRVDAAESHLRSLATLHPDNLITETGIMSEFRRHGIDSRIGKHRADVVHQTMDPIIVAGPWLLAGGVVFLAVPRSLIRSGRSKN